MPTEPVPQEHRGKEVILVVEDEHGVRSLLSRALTQLGYFVLEAKNGEDALTVLQEYHAPAHLVITDMVMPEMGGAQLIKMLHEWYPELKVLFISAYSREMIEAKGALFPGARYLAKPFTIAAMTGAVRELLDA
jgi:two-component system cell cycle sensor histidine kinase/response regulator CckA